MLMHPEAVLDALQREAERHPERRAEILAESAHWDRQERPATLLDAPAGLAADKDAVYLAALRDELDRVPADDRDRRDQILSEILRFEDREVDVVAGRVSDEEVEARRAARQGRAVERAVNQPGGRQPAVATTPAGVKKEKEGKA